MAIRAQRLSICGTVPAPETSDNYWISPIMLYTATHDTIALANIIPIMYLSV